MLLNIIPFVVFSDTSINNEYCNVYDSISIVIVVNYENYRTLIILFMVDEMVVKHNIIKNYTHAQLIEIMSLNTLICSNTYINNIITVHVRHNMYDHRWLMLARTLSVI